MQATKIKKYDTYKDSGIEWIGEIPQNWTIRKLFSLLKTIGSGTTPKGNDSYYDGDIPWLNTGDLTDSYVNIIGKTVTDNAMAECSALKLFDKDSVVIAMYGATIGKLGILTFPTTTNQACCVMSCGNQLNNKYLFYVLYSARDYILTLSYGAGQPNISQETMKSFKLCCPDIVEQQAIADYLGKKCGEIDKVVEAEKSVIEKLKEYKQSIITEAVTKGLDKTVPLKDSGIEWIGKIPQDWNINRGKNILSLLKREIKDDMDVITCFRDGEVTLRSNRREEGFTFADKEIGYQGIEIGDLVIHGMDGFAGAIGISDSYGKGSPVLNVCNPKYNYSAKYFCYYLRMLATQNIFIALATGIRERSCDLRWSKIANLLFIVPNEKEQQQIAEYLDKKCSEIDKAIADKEQLIEKFTEYKKSLIYECVTGKRKVVA